MFSEKFKKIRCDNNLSQEEMAKKLFISRSAIAKWEQGRGLPSLDMFSKISETFGISMDELIDNKDIHTITITNNENNNRIKMLMKILFLLIIILIAVTTTILIITFNERKNNEEIAVHLKNYYGEIIEIDVDTLKVSLSDDEQLTIKTTIEQGKNTTVVYDKRGKTINFNDLKLGYWINLRYKYTNDELDYSDDLESIRIIEDCPSDYMIYGVFISTINQNLDHLPLYETPFDDHVSQDAMTNGDYYEWGNQRFMNTFIYPYVLNGKTDSGTYSGRSNLWTVNDYDIELNNDSIMFAQNFEYTINMSVDIEEVFIYVVDNSEKGYTYYGSIQNEKGYATWNKVKISGYISDMEAKANKEYSRPYSVEMNYLLNINFTHISESYSVYQYDKSIDLVNEISFINYEDYMNDFDIKDDTIYCIIQSKGSPTEIKQVFIGEEYAFTLKTKYGYIIEITAIIK